MNIIQKIKYKLLGIKPRSSGEDLIPKGITRTIVPESFNKKAIWDRHLFSNIEIIKD